MSDKTTWSVAEVIWCYGGAATQPTRHVPDDGRFTSGEVGHADAVTHVLPSQEGLDFD